jgi:hypothetical protein
MAVTKLDRLARSATDLLSIVEKLAAKGVAFRMLAMNLDTQRRLVVSANEPLFLKKAVYQLCQGESFMTQAFGLVAA